MFRQCYACSAASAHAPPDQPRSAGAAEERLRGRAGQADTVVLCLKDPGTRVPGTRRRPPRAAPGAAAADDTPDYPGKRFGLPKDGPLSVAPMGRRLVALVVDWVLCYLIASSIVGHNVFAVTDAHYQDAQWVALLLFAVEVYLLTAVSGLTVGKRLLGIRAIRTDGSRPGFKWAALRTVLLLFVDPGLPDRP